MTESNRESWETLNLVVGWIKHAETKAGITLGASGVTGGLLYNLIKGEPRISPELAWASAVCAVLVVAAGLLAAWAMWPRLRFKGTVSSVVYFARIARDFGEDAAGFHARFMKVSGDQSMLRRDLAGQILANANVALVKFRWSNYALLCLVAGLAMLAVAAGVSFAT